MSQAQAAGRPENKMGVMPIPKLLISMALPMMIAMLVQALYNVVDSIFVSQLGENALTAVSLAFPIQNLMIAVATGTGVGVNALLSKSLGEKNFPLVNKAAINAVFLYVCSYLLFLVFGLTGVRFFFTSQTDVAEIVAWTTCKSAALPPSGCFCRFALNACSNPPAKPSTPCWCRGLAR